MPAKHASPTKRPRRRNAPALVIERIFIPPDAEWQERQLQALAALLGIKLAPPDAVVRKGAA